METKHSKSKHFSCEAVVVVIFCPGNIQCVEAPMEAIIYPEPGAKYRRYMRKTLCANGARLTHAVLVDGLGSNEVYNMN
jgi:hypothetical protein